MFLTKNATIFFINFLKYFNLQLCELAKESENKFCWLPRGKIINVPGILPIKTELAIFLDNDGIKSNVFLVCFSFSELRLNIRMIQYLAGLTLSTYISAHFLDEEMVGNELDAVHGTSLKLGKTSCDSKSILSDLSRSQMSNDKITGDTYQRKSQSFSRTDSAGDLSRAVNIISSSSVNDAPTWAPSRVFSFPIAQVEVLKQAEKISLGQFGNMQYVASGTNSDVFRATYNGVDVAVKMLKKKYANSNVAMQELNMEHGMLVRLSHQSIIDIVVVGESPQRFIALEYLGGGTLQRLLHEDVKSATGMNFSSLFVKKKQVLTVKQALGMAQDMASALDYLHERCCAHRRGHRWRKRHRRGLRASFRARR